MPAIRDFSQAATAVATGTTLALPVPTHVVGDLLIAFMMADTGAGAWTAAGWSHIAGSPAANVCQLACMFKVAAAGEPVEVTFTSTVSESYSGVMLSVRDVNTVAPLGAIPAISFVNQAAAAKFNMPTITTNVANAMVLYAAANSVLGVPSILEGPAFGLVAADGMAESLGVGWGFKSATGLTAANVGVSNILAGAGVNLTLQIAPPTAGAAVVPAYCAADASVYLDPLNGVTAYNANTAVAITADTGFGTALGGFTAADAAVSAAGDVGINSFHSTCRVTSITGSKNLAGVELVFAVANRPNVSGKNILCHVGPSTEGQLQRYSSIASGRGIWFGMRSGAAANYKIWQSHGVELGSLRHQPIVINDLAANTKSLNGTLAPTAVLALGWWVSGNGVVTTIWDLASLWVLDTTTVCGGNAAEPVSISGIVSVAADGKERRSVIRQGANQAIAYGPLQFGDGGTNPIFLDLNATAFEFPGQYNAALKQVTYNSVDNVAGLTYNAGASDTIKHRNSVISSPSRYHWRIHASSSASATYDFRGLSLIGAGDVVLRNVATFTGMSFGNCALVTQNSAPIASGTFSNTLVMSSLPSGISACTFTSGGTGHAIQITAPGTYTFPGNTFTGYGANDSTDAAIYNNSGGAVTLNVTNGGNTPTVRNGTAATTTVSSAISLTLTGLKTGSDIVILDAGLTVIRLQVDSHASDTFIYNFTAPGNIDIGVIKEGYVPFYIRGFTLPLANTSIPISQTFDRNFT